MMVEFLQILGMLFFIFIVATLYHVIGKSDRFPIKKKFSKLDRFMVIGVVIFDVLLFIYLIIEPTYAFISAEYTYQEYLEVMIIDSGSSLYIFLEWLIFRMIMMVYLGVVDETKLIRGGLTD